MDRLVDGIIKQRIVFGIITALIVINGVYFISITPREAFPLVELDTLMVITRYRGSTPIDTETLVTKVIEEKLKGIENIDRMDSVTIEGLSVITVRLNPDASFKNKLKAKEKIKNAIEEVKKDLPPDAETPIISELEVHRPLITVGIYGRDPFVAVDELERIYTSIPEVASISKSGYYKKEIWVEADPVKLKEKNTTIVELINAIRDANAILPGGKIYGDIEKQILLKTSLVDVDDINNVIVKSNPEGMIVRVKDVAQVFLTTERKNYISRINGVDAAKLVIRGKVNTDAIKTVEKIKEVTDEYVKKKNLGVVYSDDVTKFIKQRLKILISNGTLGAFLVAIFLGLFLSIKSAIFALLSVATTFFAGFIILYLNGYTVNLFTMFAYIFTLGMLVDSAIVITEYYERRLGSMDATQASKATVKRMFFPVFASVFTNIIGFLPLAFMTGVIGKFMRAFPVITMVLFTCNIIQSLFILPSQLTYIKNIHGSKSGGRFISILESIYGKLLRKMLLKKYTFGGIMLLIPVIIFLASRLHLKFVLFPVTVDEFYVTFELKPQSSIEKTLEVGKKLEEAVKSTGINVDSIITDIGMSVGRSGNELYPERLSYKGQVRVVLTPGANNAEYILNRNREKIIQAAKTSGAIDVAIFKRRAGPPTGSDVEVRIIGEDFEVLRKIAYEATSYLKSINGVLNAWNSWSKEIKKVNLEPERALISMAGLNIHDVARALRAAYGGEVATIIKSQEDIDVVVKLKGEYEKSLKTLEEVLVPARTGGSVPLKNLVRIREVEDFAFIDRSFADRIIKVSAEIDRTKTTSKEVNEKLKKFLESEIKKYPGYRYDFWGEEKDRIESVKALIKAMAVAISLNFVILVALFKSITAPFIIMVSIVFAFAGVFLALLLHGLPVSMLALIAMVGLTGVVVNNAILIVDTIIRNLGPQDKMEVIIKSSLERLRPIFLTSITTFIGVIPVAYGIGGRDPFLMPLALTFGWGFMFSTLLNIFFTPLLSYFLIKYK